MDILKYQKIYVRYTITDTIYTIYMTPSKITAGTSKTTSENQSYPLVIRYLRTGREFKETTYPDDSLEFPTRSHIPYNLNINQGYDILEQDIPDVVITKVYTQHTHKTRKNIHHIEDVKVFEFQDILCISHPK